MWSAPMRHWYCVHTKPHKERQAATEFTGARLRAWLPELGVLKRRHGRPVQLTEPLFPGYLFVVLDPTVPQEWNAVRWARGVRDVVGDGLAPLPVPEPAMAALRVRFGESAVLKRECFIPGGRVRVARGPMMYLEGLLLESPTPQHRVRVLMQLLRRELTVELDMFDLEPVS